MEANFFPYLEQLPHGDVATLVARDLFHWARDIADEVAFGGVKQPAFHARINLDGKLNDDLFGVGISPQAIGADSAGSSGTAKAIPARSERVMKSCDNCDLLLPKAQRFKAEMRRNATA